MKIESRDLVLESVYRWEKENGKDLYMTQPMGGGVVRTFTWAETMAEVRAMAGHLKSFGFPAGSKIAILSKNCAQFIISDLAIWMAGYVSVAMYPTLSADTITYILGHSESKLLFVGKLDTWAEQKSAVPADMPCIAYPLAPKTDYPRWDDIIKSATPIKDSPVRDADDSSALLYTSGSTGTAKGVEHTFRSMSGIAKAVGGLLNITRDDRMISYLPLAHAFERGFSTRKDKSGGMGLHWSSNTKRAMSGELVLESQGRGHGATVRLRLPLAPQNVTAIAA